MDNINLDRHLDNARLSMTLKGINTRKNAKKIFVIYLAPEWV